MTQKVSRWGLPHPGIGLGLRGPHIGHILATKPDVGWFEIITENFLVHRGYLSWVLDQLVERYPIVMHGVSLSIGSTDPLDRDYLLAVKALAERVGAPWVSDHVCWTGVGGRNSHDLLPVPYTEEMLARMTARVRQVQDILERPLFLENPSSYVEFVDSPIPEWTFIARLAEDADCGLLVDVNNIYVSSVNHGFDPADYLAAIPWDRVAQFHVAGHTDRGTHLLDTHIGPVMERVWELLRRAYALSGGRAVLLEWDDEIPDFETTWREACKAGQWLADIDTYQVDTPTPRGPGKRATSVATPDMAPGAPETEGAEGAEKTASLMHWMHAVVAGDADAERDRIAAHIRANEHLRADERIDIYTTMIGVRLVEAMREDFPAVHALLGDAFADAVAAYTREHPSTSWALEHLGRWFALWLGEADLGHAPEVAAVAALEWALVESHLADRCAPLPPSALARVAPEQRAFVRLEFAPCVRLVAPDVPVHHLLAGADAKPGGHPERVLVFRPSLSVRSRVLAGAEAAMIERLMAGDNLHDALVAVLSDHPDGHDEVLKSLPAWTERWAADGMLAAVVVPQNAC